VTAGSIAELAGKLHLDAAALQKTVDEYNRLVAGEAVPGQPPRSTQPYKAWPVRQGPFHAVEVCAGMTYTMGGIATDAQARVLDTRDQPIAGLYAAGACTGGLEGGGAAAGYSGGLSKASVFGMLAGEAIVAALAGGKAEARYA
jgi:fumarate reductase flavoprotein subunit